MKGSKPWLSLPHSCTAKPLLSTGEWHIPNPVPWLLAALNSNPLLPDLFLPPVFSHLLGGHTLGVTISSPVVTLHHHPSSTPNINLFYFIKTSSSQTHLLPPYQFPPLRPYLTVHCDSFPCQQSQFSCCTVLHLHPLEKTATLLSLMGGSGSIPALPVWTAFSTGPNCFMPCWMCPFSSVSHTDSGLGHMSCLGRGWY